MAHPDNSTSKHSNAYNLFIIALTILSLIVMAVMILPLDEDTLLLLQFYDVVICIIFLIDFTINLRASSLKSEYFIQEQDWLDLLGSIPSFGAVFKYSGLLRLARVSRLLREKGKEEIIKDVLTNRNRYTTFITIFLTILVLVIASVMVLQFESQSVDANITNGWDALWYSIVTITTVSYGDFYPVSFWGRITAVFIMIAGVGLIGVMASLLSGLLIGRQPDSEPEQATYLTDISTHEKEIVSINMKLDDVHQLLTHMNLANPPDGD